MKLPIDSIICGDNSVFLAGFPDDCIDLTVTSPPYDNLRDYKGYSWDFEGLVKQLHRVTKGGGVVVWVVGDSVVNGSETGVSFKQALYFMECGFNLHDTMIYEKDSLNMPMSNRYYQTFEFMFVLSKGNPKTVNLLQDKTKYVGKDHSTTTTRQKDGSLLKNKYKATKETRSKTNVWRYSVGYMKSTTDKKAFDHPAIFPEALARDHILSWSKPGDLVLDPFSGSGTTAKMAKENGRHWIGIDLSADYCKLSEKRIHGANIPLMVLA
jgi:site-specific DNA-methyltransferase (adenine-specific)